MVPIRNRRPITGSVTRSRWQAARQAIWISLLVNCPVAYSDDTPSSVPSSRPSLCQPSDEDVTRLNAVAQRPLDWCDAEWLARALAALPTRKPDGKPIIWGACEPATCLKNQPTVEQLARTTGSVPVLINKRPERADSHADRWYRQAMVIARRYGAQVTATMYPLQFYFFRHIAEEPQAWHGKPGTEVKYPAVGVCLNYRSRALEEDLRRMRHALRAARQAGLEVDYFFVDVEYVVGSQSKALAQQRAVYQRCERCRGLAGHNRALLALRREISATIREVYPAAKQAWYNLGWTMRRGRLIPCASITQFWPRRR